MTRGRKICDALKSIRREIAAANDISYSPRECHHEGECAGSCPACESEVRYLERELERRRRVGKAAVVAGLSLSLATLTACSCTGRQNAGQAVRPDSTCVKASNDASASSEVVELEGDVPAIISSSVSPAGTTKGAAMRMQKEQRQEQRKSEARHKATLPSEEMEVLEGEVAIDENP